MVNVPPIPPLLCSTPPPIDSGEEDDDVDISPTLSGVAGGEDYGDFLTVIDIPGKRFKHNCKLYNRVLFGKL